METVPDELDDATKGRLGAWARKQVRLGALPPSFARAAVLERECGAMLDYWAEKAETTKKKIPVNWERAARNWLRNAARFQDWTGVTTSAMPEGTAAKMTEELFHLRRIK